MTHFKKGDFVSGKKWNGEDFIGIYELRYDCGEHLIFDGNVYSSIHEGDCHRANQQQAELIKKNVLRKDKPPIGTITQHNAEQMQKQQNNIETLFEEEI